MNKNIVCNILTNYVNIIELCFLKKLFSYLYILNFCLMLILFTFFKLKNSLNLSFKKMEGKNCFLLVKQ